MLSKVHYRLVFTLVSFETAYYNHIKKTSNLIHKLKTRRFEKYRQFIFDDDDEDEFITKRKNPDYITKLRINRPIIKKRYRSSEKVKSVIDLMDHQLTNHTKKIVKRSKERFESNSNIPDYRKYICNIKLEMGAGLRIGIINPLKLRRYLFGMGFHRKVFRYANIPSIENFAYYKILYSKCVDARNMRLYYISIKPKLKIFIDKHENDDEWNRSHNPILFEIIHSKFPRSNLIVMQVCKNIIVKNPELSEYRFKRRYIDETSSYSVPYRTPIISKKYGSKVSGIYSENKYRCGIKIVLSAILDVIKLYSVYNKEKSTEYSVIVKMKDAFDFKSLERVHHFRKYLYNAHRINERSEKYNLRFLRIGFKLFSSKSFYNSSAYFLCYDTADHNRKIKKDVLEYANSENGNRKGKKKNNRD